MKITLQTLIGSVLIVGSLSSVGCSLKYITQEESDKIKKVRLIEHLNDIEEYLIIMQNIDQGKNERARLWTEEYLKRKINLSKRYLEILKDDSDINKEVKENLEETIKDQISRASDYLSKNGRKK
ncbi:hypothetical protein HYX16_01105 [Candidatus Woesearchaeota archaeon]|nr:hypothetical protein [Candidatus Woesearchaeota archaeon]